MKYTSERLLTTNNQQPTTNNEQRTMSIFSGQGLLRLLCISWYKELKVVLGQTRVKFSWLSGRIEVRGNRGVTLRQAREFGLSWKRPPWKKVTPRKAPAARRSKLGPFQNIN